MALLMRPTLILAGLSLILHQYLGHTRSFIAIAPALLCPTGYWLEMA
jgi:hypothetical protein